MNIGAVDVLAFWLGPEVYKSDCFSVKEEHYLMSPRLPPGRKPVRERQEAERAQGHGV